MEKLIYFMCGVYFILVSIPALLGKNKSMGVGLFLVGALQIVLGVTFVEVINEEILFVCYLIVGINTLIAFTMLRKINTVRVMLLFFILLLVLGCFIFNDVVEEDRYIYQIALIGNMALYFAGVDLVLIYSYFKKRRNSNDIENRERKIIEYFQEKLPEEEFYFTQRLECVVDVTEKTILRGVILNRNLFVNGCRGIKLEICSNKDLKKYVERYEDFLSRDLVKGIEVDEEGVKRLKTRFGVKDIFKEGLLFIGQLMILSWFNLFIVSGVLVSLMMMY